MRLSIQGDATAMTMLAMFLPLAKVDVDQRTVQGVATAEKPDRSGEICDYASSKPYFEAWSAEAKTASGGKSLGAVRAMHGLVAAGKLTSIDFDDNNKRIVVAAKIIDDDEWEKVLEGVYTGFSQGGRYVDKWQDEDTGLTRYTAEPHEISLVDLPCLPDATFELVRSGVSEFRKFIRSDPSAPLFEPTVAPVAAEAKPLEKPAHIEALGKAAIALTEAAGKLERVIEENLGLRKAVAEFAPRLTELGNRLAALEAQPTPPRALLRAPPRESDARGATAASDIDNAIKQLAALPDEQRALALTKVSLANPIVRNF
jgi:hypothetical protein